MINECKNYNYKKVKFIIQRTERYIQEERVLNVETRQEKVRL